MSRGWNEKRKVNKGLLFTIYNSYGYTAALVTTFEFKETANLWKIERLFPVNVFHGIGHLYIILTTSLFLGAMFWEKPSLAAQAAAT